jgi:hypothetical protein
MNWYKLSQESKESKEYTQIPDFPTYLSQQINQLSDNYTKSIPYRIKKMLDYIPFMEQSITKYNVPYEQLTLEELFRTCTYIMVIEKNPKNIASIPENIRNTPAVQAVYQKNKKP